MGPRGPKDSPRWIQAGSKIALEGPQDGSVAAKMLSRKCEHAFPMCRAASRVRSGSQEDPKVAQQGLKKVQDVPEMAQHGLKLVPRHTFPSFPAGGASRVRSGPQNGPQIVQHGSKKAQITARRLCRRVRTRVPKFSRSLSGPNWPSRWPPNGPTWFQEGPRWSQ